MYFYHITRSRWLERRTAFLCDSPATVRDRHLTGTVNLSPGAGCCVAKLVGVADPRFDLVAQRDRTLGVEGGLGGIGRRASRGLVAEEVLDDRGDDLEVAGAVQALFRTIELVTQLELPHRLLAVSGERPVDGIDVRQGFRPDVGEGLRELQRTYLFGILVRQPKITRIERIAAPRAEPRTDDTR